MDPTEKALKEKLEKEGEQKAAPAITVAATTATRRNTFFNFPPRIQGDLQYLLLRAHIEALCDWEPITEARLNSTSQA